MTKTLTKCKRVFLQDSTKERMNHFSISVTVKLRRDNNCYLLTNS